MNFRGSTGSRPPYDHPPPDKNPEEKEFDRKIKTLEIEIERLTNLRDAYLEQRRLEKELGTVVSNTEIAKKKLESMKILIKELSKNNSSENPR